MSLQEARDYLQIVSYLAVVFGIPWGLYQHYRAVKREQLDRERGTYDALDEKYLEYQRLCLAHPTLDVFDLPLSPRSPLSPQEERQELIILTMLMSIFERAYLMYSDQSSSIKHQQWSGWDEYIQSFCSRESFRKTWKASGKTFDKRFEDYMRINLQRFTPPIKK